MIPKHYQFRETEKRIYDFWQQESCFKSVFDKNGKVQPKRAEQVHALAILKNQKNSGLHQSDNSNQTDTTDLSQLEKYVMVIPPPNVTGRLHMGHALNNTIQDLLMRYHRMNGKDTLWIPGTDHAGIATQTVVKKMLDEQGMDYRTMGRVAFNEAVWKWKDKYGDIILGQLRALGISSDWDRVAYTMDEGPSQSVRHAFVKLYKDGYIYRAKRIVNWCPIDKTALSDDEVDTAPEGESGFLYQIAYPLVGSVEVGMGGNRNTINKINEIIVSTTRPETLFGDVAVAVHPQDERYRSVIGKKLRLPLTNREIPIIADEYVDRSFGTGCLKITPAHDPNDFVLGESHGFTPINIMHEDATLNDEVPKTFRGLGREQARKQVVVALEKEGLFRGKTERMIPVGRSYRSKAIIEYRLSDQWFVKMKPLTEAVMERSDLNIYPANYIKLWNHWLTNIKDWCISRQIWWGHQIPAWFNKTTGEILVSGDTPAVVEKNPEAWEQDSDVLDTWFSSALWPMSTLGWPNATPDFNTYFATTALSTAKDIMFFWVARMCLMALYFEKVLPFNHVYFHPTVMDHRGKIMSKSKGNGIDPQHIISGATVEELKAPVMDARPANLKDLFSEIEVKYKDGFVGVGADAMRYTLIYLSSHLQSLQISLDSFLELGRRFTDKLWNASRLIFLYLEKISAHNLLQGKTTRNHDYSNTATLWMEARCYRAWQDVAKAVENYDFSSLGQTYYNLVWSDFCDWYLEAVKLRLVQLEAQGVEQADGVNALVELIAQFEKILTLLHPLIPFLSEELYQKLVSWSREQGLVLRTDGAYPLMVSPFLTTGDFCFKNIADYHQVEHDFQLVQDAVGTLRNYQKNILVSRNTNTEKKEKPQVYYTSNTPGHEEILGRESALIIHHAKLNNFEPLPKSFSFASQEMVKLVKEDYTLYLPKAESSVLQNEEIALLKSNLAKLIQDEVFINKRLSNPGFVQNANPELLAKENERLEKIKQAVAELKAELAKIEKNN